MAQSNQARTQTPDNPAVERPKAVPTEDIDRVIQIIKSLPNLRRYGGDEAAMKEAIQILEAVKERL